MSAKSTKSPDPAPLASSDLESAPSSEGPREPGRGSEPPPADAAPSDAALSDAAPSDAAPSDAAPSDAAPSDAALSDAALSDAALSDEVSPEAEPAASSDGPPPADLPPRPDGSPGGSHEPPVKGAYYVTLASFEGPLDLLLHLIQQHELDITDIPIAFVSQKYVEYLMLMQELNIDLASEYLVMAATLAHIKSKMLLPVPPAGQEDDAADEIDPRAELVRRLLEYQKYKQASEQLASSPVLGRDVFGRGASTPEVDGPAPLAQVSVFKLFDAFQRLLSRVKQTAEHLIDVDRISISERIIQLTDRLKGLGDVCFEQLFEEEATRSDIVVTFLALLEMTRLRMLLVFQDGPLAEITVRLTITDEQEEVLRRDAADGDPLADLMRGEFPLEGSPLQSPVVEELAIDAPAPDDQGEAHAEPLLGDPSEIERVATGEDATPASESTE